MPAWAGRIGRGVSKGVLALGVLLIAAAAGLWWWAGQEGSLEWTLQRVARGQPLQLEGVRGAVRSGWHIDRLAWESDGLRIEAEQVDLKWQPLALLSRTLRLDEVRAAKLRVVDGRPASTEPLRAPEGLALPWRITLDEFALARVEYQGKVAVAGDGLAGRYAFDGLKHTLNVRSLRYAGGSYQGEATVSALAPMTLAARIGGELQTRVPGVDAQVPLSFELRAEGNVSAIDATGQLRVREGGAPAASTPSASVTARITPFEPMPVPSALADFRQLDAAQFWSAAPKTLLSGRVRVQPAGTATWQLEADVRNASAGPWDDGLLPVEQLKAEGRWRDGTALVESLLARVGGGTVEGAGAWEGKGWRFDGRVREVDPARLHGSLASLPVSGSAKLKGEVQGGSQAVDFDVDLQAASGPAKPTRRKAAAGPSAGDAAQWLSALELREAVARGRWSGRTVSLPRLRVRTSDALLEGNVDVDLAASAGSGKLALRAPGLEGRAEGALAETRGQGSVVLNARDLAQLQQWLARWPGLQALRQPPLQGALDGTARWQGGWRDPSVQARVGTTNLQVGAAPAAGANTPPPWRVRSAEVRLEGRLRDARFDVTAEAEQGQRKVSLQAGGRAGHLLAAGGSSWRGQLAALQLAVRDPALTDAAWQLQLRRPVDWRAGGANFELAAGEAVLRAPAMRGGAPAADAVLTWAPVRRQGGQLTTAGKLAGLPMAWIELFGGPQLAGSALSGDMVFDAEWNAQLGATMRVNASLTRVRGDVTVLAESADGAAARVAAGVRTARVTLENQGDQLALALLWDSERAGRAEGVVRTRLVRTTDGGWQWPADAPLSGGLKANLPRIGVWSLLAPPGWRLRGSLDADIAVGGTRSQPDFSGPINADDLALRSVVDGIEMRNGRLRARLAGTKLVVNEFLLRGGGEEADSGGTLVAYGEGSWTPQGMQLQVDATLTQLRASLRSDRQLTVSGPLAARMDRSGTRITGKLEVDRARITIPDETAPKLGDDVLVRNAVGLATTEAERKLRPAPSTPGRTVTLAIEVDLGNDFRVAGRGVDTRLAGQLRVDGQSLTAPRLVGTINTVGGVYNGYGQRMNIERGEIRFTGPVDNPALDILAIRPNLDLRVGVQITGRAQAPHVELYSEAGMSEAETLSYLVLGRSSAGGGAEAALLQRAAAALLAGRRGSGKGLAGSFGLDDVSVRNDSAAGPVVRVGKRFADNERSLSGAMGTLYIFYDISQRLTVRAETGERTGLDLIFTFYFDREYKKKEAAKR